VKSFASDRHIKEIVAARCIIPWDKCINHRSFELRSSKVNSVVITFCRQFSSLLFSSADFEQVMLIVTQTTKCFDVSLTMSNYPKLLVSGGISCILVTHVVFFPFKQD
jgi:hypothetical protein